MSVSKLDMNHGFLWFITKNQIDRDNYDKEMKAKAMESTSKKTSTTPRSAKPKSDRPKRPEIPLYQPRARMSTSTSTDVPAKEMSTGPKSHTKVDVNFKDERGVIHRFRVHSSDHPDTIARGICSKMGYSDLYITPLKAKIIEQCSPYFTFTPTST